MLKNLFYDVAASARGRQVDDALVFAAPELEHQAAGSELKSAVYKDITEGEEPRGIGIGLGPCEQFLVGVARVDHHRDIILLELLAELSEGSRLTEGLAPRKGDALEQWIAPVAPEELISIDKGTGGKVVGLGIVASGAAMGAALGKDYEAQARPVDNGILCDA